jgi:cytochrome c-type biogenesis protein CcmE
MSPVQKKRLIVVISLISGIGIAGALILFALSKNINLFYSPTQLFTQSQAVQGKNIRIGGMVIKNSIQRKENLKVEFWITDFKHQVKVCYDGILPDLFKEGQGVVAQGQMNAQGQFQATQVLAKHDEKYMPPEVRDALKEKA